MKIKISGIDYDIDIIEDYPVNKNGDKYKGLIEYEQAKITISSIPNYQVMYEILWHEIFHGLFNAYGIFLDSKKEEHFCDCFSSGIIQLLKDNPELANVNLFNEKVN